MVDEKNNYECKKCNKKFTMKHNLTRHLNNCNKGGSKTNKKHLYNCSKCGTGFTRKDALTRHINKKTCIKNKKQCNNKINGNNNKQKNVINNKNVKNNKNVTVGNNNNMLVNSPVMINLVLFTKDGIENISRKELAKILTSNKNLFESIISSVNLNPDKPQHHNVYYGDIKSSYGEVYEKNKWVKMKIDEILDSLIEAKIDDLNLILNDMQDILNKKTRNKIREAIENADYTKPGTRKKLKSYLKPILYNHKDIIIKTRKLTKEQEEEIFRKEQEEAEREAAEEEKILKQKIKRTISKQKI